MPSRADLGPALGLVLPDDTLVPVHFALDPVLKYATRLGELSNNLVATLSFNISTKTGRKVQGLLNGRNMDEYVLRTVIRLNKSVALLGVEPLYCSASHRTYVPSNTKRPPSSI